MSENFLAWNGTNWADAGTTQGPQLRPHYPYDMVVADINGTGQPVLIVAGAPAVNQPTWPIVGAYDGTDWVPLDGPGTPSNSTPSQQASPRPATAAAPRSVTDRTMPRQFSMSRSAHLQAGIGSTPRASASPRATSCPTTSRYSSPMSAGPTNSSSTAHSPPSTASQSTASRVGTALRGKRRNGLTTSVGPSSFRAHAVAFDDGSGLKLFVGGTFNTAGGVATPRGVATWNGSAWANASTGLGAIGSTDSYRFFVSGGQLFAMKRGGFTGENVYRWNGTQWNAVSTLPVGLSFGSPVPLGNADLGSGEQHFFNEDFIGLWSFDPQTLTWEDRTPLSGTIIGSSQKLTRYDVNGQHSYFLSGTFDHVEGEMVGGHIFFDSAAGLSTTGTVGIARLFCPDIVAMPCPCDFNNNGLQEIGDYFSFLTAFFAQLGGQGSADFDNDGTVTIGDYFAFLSCLPDIAASTNCP